MGFRIFSSPCVLALPRDVQTFCPDGEASGETLCLPKSNHPQETQNPIQPTGSNGTAKFQVLLCAAASTEGPLGMFKFGRTGETLESLSTGRAPMSLALDAENGELFVKEFLSRTIGVYDVSELLDGRTNSAERVATVPVVKQESLREEILIGKQIFWDASDPRMAREGYLTCVSCHFEGEHDGQSWDFTQAGEGVRNTISLSGRAGTAFGKLHWSSNFDEIQDFENDIRDRFGGTGFLSKKDYRRSQMPLGRAKTGRSSDLDSLAAYVRSLGNAPQSPYRALNGEFTADAVDGEAQFLSLGCDTCHAGVAGTDSERHQVSSVAVDSGNTLWTDGVVTPPLFGLWLTSPYLHNGSTSELAEAIEQHASEFTELDDEEQYQLVRYLLERESAAPAEVITAISSRHRKGRRIIGSCLARDGTPLSGARISVSLKRLNGRSLPLRRVRCSKRGRFSFLVKRPKAAQVIRYDLEAALVP